MLKHMVDAMPRLGTSLPMKTPHGILMSLLLRICTFSVPWGCLMRVILFTAKPGLFLHLQAMERDLPSACELKTMAVLSACTQSWEHSFMWWITQWRRWFSSLSSPSSTALLLAQCWCRVQWTREISPSEKLDQDFKPIYFPELHHSYNGAGREREEWPQAAAGASSASPAIGVFLTWGLACVSPNADYGLSKNIDV